MTKFVETFGKFTGLALAIMGAITLFFGVVAWLAAKEAIILVATISVWLTAFFALLFGVFFVIERFDIFRVRHAETRRDRTLANSETTLSELHVGRDAMRVMSEGRLLDAAILQVETGKIHPASLGEGLKFSSFPLPAIKHFENETPLLEAPSLPLLPAIRNCQNVLIVGGKGSGKTTLLQHLEAERLNNNKMIVLDSHAQPSQWLGEMVGLGREYGNIKNAMIALTNLLHQRYQNYATGQSNFEPISTIIDEFTLLPVALKKLDFNIQDYSLSALTEGRKVQMSCLWGIHSDRAKLLGLEGMSDIRECFDATIYLKNANGKRFALVDFGEGKQEQRYEHPGPFIIHQRQQEQLPAPTFAVVPIPEPEPEPEPEVKPPSDIEMEIIMRFQEVRDGDKFSWNKATQACFGNGKFGTNYTAKLKRLLDKFSIDHQGSVSK